MLNPEGQRGLDAPCSRHAASGGPRKGTRWTACRSVTMRCCRTAARRRWSAGTARWTGCASPASTGRRCSAACLTPPAGVSRSGPPASSRPAADTWTRRWCWRPPSPPRAAPPCSPTRSRSAATSAATTWVHTPPACCCAGSPAPAARSKRRSAMRPGRSTASSTRSWFRSPAGSPPGAAPTGCCCPPRSASTSTAPPRPPGSGWPPGRPPCSRSATGRWPGRHWPPGPRRRSPPGWRTRWRAGGPGRRSTRTTRGRGGSWCTIPGGCCRR